MRGVSGLVGAAVVALIAVAAIASYAYLTAQQASQAARISASVASAAAAVKEDLTLYVNGSWVWAAPKVGNPRIVTYWYVWRGGRPSKPHPCNILLTGPKPIAPWPPNATDLIAKTALGNIYHLNIKPNATITATEEYYMMPGENVADFSSVAVVRYVPVDTFWTVDLIKTNDVHGYWAVGYLGSKVDAVFPSSAPVLVTYVLPKSVPHIYAIVNDSLRLGKFVVGGNLTYGSEALIEKKEYQTSTTTTTFPVVTTTSIPTTPTVTGAPTPTVAPAPAGVPALPAPTSGSGGGGIYGRVYPPQPLAGVGVKAVRFNVTFKKWVLVNATFGADRNATVTFAVHTGSGWDRITLRVGDAIPDPYVWLVTKWAFWVDGVEVYHRTCPIFSGHLHDFISDHLGSGSFTLTGYSRGYYWYYGFSAAGLDWVKGVLNVSSAVTGIEYYVWNGVRYVPYWINGFRPISVTYYAGKRAWAAFGLPVSNLKLLTAPSASNSLIANVTVMTPSGAEVEKRSLKLVPIGVVGGMPTYAVVAGVPVKAGYMTYTVLATVYNATSGRILWGDVQYMTFYSLKPVGIEHEVVSKVFCSGGTTTASGGTISGWGETCVVVYVPYTVFEVAPATQGYVVFAKTKMNVLNGMAYITYSGKTIAENPHLKFTLTDPSNPAGGPAAVIGISVYIPTTTTTTATGTGTTTTQTTTTTSYTPPPPLKTNSTPATETKTTVWVHMLGKPSGVPIKTTATVYESPMPPYTNGTFRYYLTVSYTLYTVKPMPVPEGGSTTWSFTWVLYLVSSKIMKYVPVDEMSARIVFGTVGSSTVPMMLRFQVYKGVSALTSAYFQLFNFAGIVTYTVTSGGTTTKILILPIAPRPKPTAMIWWGAVGVFLLFGFGGAALTVAALRGRGIDVVGRVREVVGGRRIEWGAYIASLVFVFVLLALA